MIIVSDCCQGEVLEGTKREYPLGGKRWFQSYKVQYCESCGKECEEMEVEING